jgi:hypothetical protein
VKAPDVAANAVDGSNVVDNSIAGADVNESSLNLAAPPWRVVGSAGQPAFHETADCKWHNYDSVHSTAAFLRDSAGFVHLKGTVLAEDKPASNTCDDLSSDPTDPLIFVLPPGYRPPKREAMAVLTASSPAQVGVVGIDGPAISPLPAGAVSVDSNQLGANPYFTLDGISFRCAPSGSNGCP